MTQRDYANEAAMFGHHVTHTRRRPDAVLHSGRDYVPTIYGQHDEKENTIIIDTLAGLKAAGGEIVFNEDQTEIWLRLPEKHKFSCQMFRKQEPSYQLLIAQRDALLAACKRVVEDAGRFKKVVYEAGTFAAVNAAIAKTEAA